MVDIEKCELVNELPLAMHGVILEHVHMTKSCKSNKFQFFFLWKPNSKEKYGRYFTNARNYKKILWKPNINRKYGKYFTKTHTNRQTED